MAAVDSRLDELFHPIAINGVVLKNRFVMPAMQRGWCSEGAPRAELAEYYRRRVEGGVALVIGESCAIDHPSATAQPIACRLDVKTAPAWAKCVEAVRNAGGQMLLQLWHEGALRNDDDGLTVSASGLGHPGLRRGRAATVADFEVLRDGYVRSARLAQQIGATGIELHCAHGYMLDQFMWQATNQRTDGYGGVDIRKRARFPSELLRDIRDACGKDFLVSVRFSQWKEHDFAARIAKDPEELGILLDLFRDAGADMIHASTRRFWEPAFSPDARSLANWTKMLSGLPTIAVGSVGLDRDVMQSFSEDGEAQGQVSETLDRLATGLAQQDFDLIAVGRSLIGDPDFVNKIRDGQSSRIRLFRKRDIETLNWEM